MNLQISYIDFFLTLDGVIMIEQNSDKFKFERRIAVFVAVAVVALVMYLVIRSEPFVDPQKIVWVRILLALTVGIIGATIPGLLNVTYNFAGFGIRAAGAMGLFVITFFGTPQTTVFGLQDNTEYNDLIVQVSRHLTDPNNCRTALQGANKLIVMRPNKAVPRNLKGSAYYCLGEIANALRAFDQSLAKDHEYRPARFNKAAALIRLGDYENAKNILTKFVDLDTGHLSARYNLAVAQANLGEFKNSFNNFNFVYKAEVKKNFDSAFGLGVLHLLYSKKLSVREAARLLKFSVSIKPGILCLLYGSLPNDPELHEHKPYLDLYSRLKNVVQFTTIQSEFEKKHDKDACSSVPT